MVNYKIVQSLDELPQFDIALPVFCDSETDGFYMNTRLVQMYQPEVSELIYVLDTDIVLLSDIIKILKPLWTVWHNASYDFGTLRMTTEQFDDTLYLCRNAYPDWGEYALDKCVAKLGLAHLYDDLHKKTMQKSFMKGAYLSQAQYKYSATDVYALWHIWQNKMIQKCRDIIAYKIDIISLKYSIQYQQNGLISHQPSVRQELDKIEGQIKANELALNGLNTNSPKQCKEALGVESTDKNTLIDLITKGNSLAKLVFDQRRLLKRRTMLHNYNFPKVYTFFNPAGAATGRFTATGGDLHNGINAQQITRNLQYIFNMNTEDTVVVHADFSTAELRAGCSIMKDAKMYEELKAGMDLHKIAATLAMPGKKPEEITKEERQKGKAISFGFIFGMSADSFQEYAYVNYGVTFTLDECRAIKKAYSDRYVQINKYHKEKWNSYKTEPVTTPLGRRNKARLGTDAINYATQGCIAETTKLAVHYLVKDYPDAVRYIFNVVHDALYLRVPRGEEAIWAPRVIAAMKKGWTEMCKMPMLYYKDIPMPVELEYTCPETGKHIVIEE